MSLQIPGAFERLFSDTPYRKLRVFLLVVAVFLVVIGSFAYFQNWGLQRMKDPLAEEKAQALSDLQQRLSTSPPASPAERNKALLDLQQRLKAQSKK